MSADFWAGYISGAVGIVVGNPLDVIKVRLQAAAAAAAATVGAPAAAAAAAAPPRRSSWLVKGAAAPVLGYGALNALLFVSYNRSERAINGALGLGAGEGGGSLWATFAAGMIGGLATWVVSTPTELIKCRAQLAESSSWSIARQVVRTEGVRGLYLGGVVTAIRDSVGYGFYFWSYELGTRLLDSSAEQQQQTAQDAAKVLLCGGVAGIVTWASIFPLDVIKTRVQAQVLLPAPGAAAAAAAAAAAETRPLVVRGGEGEEVIEGKRRKGALRIAREAYREGGVRVFFRGLTVCCVRAFIVNAVQWAVYEYVMREMGQGRYGVKEDPAAAAAPLVG